MSACFPHKAAERWQDEDEVASVLICSYGHTKPWMNVMVLFPLKKKNKTDQHYLWRNVPKDFRNANPYLLSVTLKHIKRNGSFFPHLTNPRNWCCKKELTPDLSSHIFPIIRCWYPKTTKPLTDKLVEIADSSPEGIISKSAFADFFQKNGINKRGKVLIYHLNPPMHCGSQSTGLSYQMWSVHCQGGAFPDLHLQNQFQVREGWAEFTCQEKVPDIQAKTTD